MQYIRKKPKGFGRNAQIEGDLHDGGRALLVEDLATDGRSKVNFCNALREAGQRCDHAFVFFFYGIFPQTQALMAELGVTLHYLTTWRDVLAAARESHSFERSTSMKSRSSCPTLQAGRRRMAASRSSSRRVDRRLTQAPDLGPRDAAHEHKRLRVQRP